MCENSLLWIYPQRNGFSRDTLQGAGPIQISVYTHQMLSQQANIFTAQTC